MSQLFVDNIKRRTGGDVAHENGSPGEGNGGSGIVVIRYLAS